MKILGLPKPIHLLLIYAQRIYQTYPNTERNEPLFSTEDKEILSILEKLEQIQSASITNSNQISGYFWSDTVFNLSKKSLVRYGI